ncbi:manganese superoxide dismutase precursor [Sordaria brevicollis]|uniref:Superoxide dismutase n=1 Tax=Sordaria brevicollis TaxID=83679 RepID=A0AAE0UGJ1_SORBR|nr:manganese superoxide dismutase precursor [Sordaria brevicollis]
MVNLGNLWQNLLASQAPLQSAMTGNATTMSGLATYTLPQLPYAYNALEPYISAQIMELHHSKHHQTYVTNLNNAIQAHVAAITSKDISAQIAQQPAIKFNGGGHINHSLFWKNLAPAETPETSYAEAAPSLAAEIEKTWGSFEGFKKAFNTALLGVQGSGWGWLVKESTSSGGRLRIITTKDQDPVVGGEVPVFGVDMWEHAYYLQYLNGKAAYVENIWKVINWKTAEERFQASWEDAFADLKALL